MALKNVSDYMKNHKKLVFKLGVLIWSSVFFMWDALVEKGDNILKKNCELTMVSLLIKRPIQIYF